MHQTSNLWHILVLFVIANTGVPIAVERFRFMSIWNWFKVKCPWKWPPEWMVSPLIPHSLAGENSLDRYVSWTFKVSSIHGLQTYNFTVSAYMARIWQTIPGNGHVTWDVSKIFTAYSGIVVHISSWSQIQCLTAKELIKKMEGGFDGLNKFVRETIWHALKASHQNFETTFRGFLHGLYFCFLG